MKKAISLAVALLLTVSMAVPAFAADITSPSTNLGEGSYTLGVNGSFSAFVPADTVISVDIEWTALDFTYDAGAVGTWNSTSHKYENGREGAWSDNQATITVTNHSNADITAGFSFASTAEGVNGVFTKTSFDVVSADDDQYRSDDPSVQPTAPSDSTKFNIDPNSSPISETQTLGTITVSIAKKTA